MVAEVVERERERVGLAARPVTDEEIVTRAVLAMSNEAALLLEEGVAARASDVDLMMVLGYGFPRHRGGPAFWAAHGDPAVVERSLGSLARHSGAGFRRGDFARLAA